MSPAAGGSMAIEERAQLLANIANMYYEQHMTQAEIAREIGYSRSAVSRLLLEAHQRGIVEIRIHFPLNRAIVLERTLRQRYGLRDVFVLAKGTANDQRALRQLGRLGAACLDEVMTQESILGISWGTAIYEVANALHAREWTKVRVVQMIGAAGRGDPLIDGPELARSLAQTLGADYYTLNAPLIVDDPSIRHALMQESNIRETLALASQADVALVGIGSVEPEISSLVRAGYTQAKEMMAIKATGAVGDICACHYDNDGRILDIDINQRAIGVSLQTLSRPNCTVIGVAGGARKAAAILGALRGHYVDILVTDSMAAERILDLDETEVTEPSPTQEPRLAGAQAD
jgi:deoxyribonucleoside regulator